MSGSIKLRYVIIVFVIAGSVVINSCRQPENAKVIVPVNYNDTSYLKTVKWAPLNEFVSYHIIQPGKAVQDTALRFRMTTLAYQYTLNKHFSLPRHKSLLEGGDSTDNSKILSPEGLNQYILSKAFSDKVSLDCLLKINSRIFYAREPRLLKNITVIPKVWDTQSIHSQVNGLKNEKFTESVQQKNRPRSFVDSIFGKMMHRKTSPFFIEITVKPQYRNLTALAEIAKKLKLQANVDNVMYVSMFSGRTNSDDFYRLTSAKKVN